MGAPRHNIQYLEFPRGGFGYVIEAQFGVVIMRKVVRGGNHTSRIGVGVFQ